MKLKKQLQILINEAPDYGVSSLAMEKGVIPILKGFAQQLKHPNYYLLTSSQEEWILTTICHRENPQQEKTVVYAFSTPDAAAKFQGVSSTQINTIAIPTTHLLFQLFAIEQIDSIIFMDRGDNLSRGTEIPRQTVKDSIQKQLRELKNLDNKSGLA